LALNKALAKAAFANTFFLPCGLCQVHYRLCQVPQQWSKLNKPCDKQAASVHCAGRRRDSPWDEREDSPWVKVNYTVRSSSDPNVIDNWWDNEPAFSSTRKHHLFFWREHHLFWRSTKYYTFNLTSSLQFPRLRTRQECQYLRPKHVTVTGHRLPSGPRRLILLLVVKTSNETFTIILIGHAIKKDKL
jgi:hypothetical protein